MGSLRRTRFYASVLLLLLSAMAGCVLLRPNRDDPNPQNELIFSHARHAKMDIKCIECHDASKSVVAADSLLPKEDACMTCHSRMQGCELCHSDADRARASVPRNYGFRFNHSVHLKPEVNPRLCEACHADIEKSVLVSQTYPIRESDCLVCHKGEMSVAEKCGYCHDSLPKTNFTPASHDANWLDNHAASAAKADGLCDVCHRGTVRGDFLAAPKLPTKAMLTNHSASGDIHACADCHQADIWSRGVHDANYLQQHSLDAKLDTTTCQSCHAQSECQACHEQTGLTFLEVHPADFALNHADEARRSLGTCATCHEESRCLSCHQGVKPHPPGWDADITAANRHLCIQCHLSGRVEDD